MFITRPTLRPTRPEATAWALALLVLAVSPMSGQGVRAAEQEAPASDSPVLLVLAASSLGDVLPAIASVWESLGGPRVRFSFDATSRLAPQAVAGARADVFISADAQWMRWLEGRDAAEPGDARIVATNDLVVVVPRGAAAPSGPNDLEGFTRIALAGESVPAGRYARAALASTGMWDRVRPRVVSGGSVRSVLEWVARGEVPVGVVYRTDAIAEPTVSIAFAFEPDTHQTIDYWAVPLATSSDPEAARAFVEFVGGPTAGDMLLASGFSLPVAPIDEGAPPVAESPRASLPSVGSAVRLSLLIAFAATLIGFVPAVALGWVLARRDFRGKAFVSTAVLAPLVIPPVVTGFLLLSLLGTHSPLGRLLASLGLPVPFTVLGATIAALIVGLPLYVLSVRGAFEAVDPLYEELSWTLGVTPRKTFFRVSLPLALPGVAAGAILAFARALGEFGATVVLAGNVEGSTRTIALAVYTLLESPSGRESTWILVGASVALSLVALLGFETLSRRQRLRMEDDRGR